MNGSSRGSGSTLAVGVYDEPELIVSGIDGMLSRTNADVVTIGAHANGTTVDVLLCDPVGRPVRLEDYLAVVAGLTAAPVVVFTWSSSRSSVRRSLAAGARGFVSKSATSDVRVRPGQHAVDPRDDELGLVVDADGEGRSASP